MEMHRIDFAEPGSFSYLERYCLQKCSQINFFHAHRFMERRNIISYEKPMKGSVSYPALTVCCRQLPWRQAWAQTPPNFGWARSQLRRKPAKCTQQYVSQWRLFGFLPKGDGQVHDHTCSSSSSLFFLSSDWFLLGNRKSSAAVGTPGNTATRSCSAGKSDTCGIVKILFHFIYLFLDMRYTDNFWLDMNCCLPATYIST